jgi:putative DNA primase/helicase
MSAEKSEYEREHDTPTYTLLSGAEVEDAPGTEWLVKGVIPTQGLAAIYGPSASGKTFLALDLALTLASGAKWFGHRIPRNVPVVYAPLEARGGIKLRLRAWRTARESESLPSGFRVLGESQMSILNPDDVDALGRCIVDGVGPGAVVMLDTLHRAMSGADENSASDMGSVIEGAQQLQGLTGGLVILIHHSGKDASRGMRGSSALFAAMDAVVAVTSEGSGSHRRWTLEKSKDGEAGTGEGFKLRQVSWGLDADGEPLNSCVVEECQMQALPIKEPRGANQRTALQKVRALLAIGAETPDWKGLTKRAAVDGIAAELAEEGAPAGRCRERASEALNALIAAEYLRQQGGGLSLDKALISEPQ